MLTTLSIILQAVRSCKGSLLSEQNFTATNWTCYCDTCPYSFLLILLMLISQLILMLITYNTYMEKMSPSLCPNAL